MNQTYVDQEAYEWEGYYAYSIVGGFLVLTPINIHNFSPTLEE
jgi:hypothetical protein